MFQIFNGIIFRFFSILILQVLIFNNISLFDFSVPYVYMLFIIILPFEINKVALLLLGFFTGLLVDYSIGTIGVHAGATVFIAYLRPFILRYFAPRGGYVVNTQPLLSDYGLAWFFKYSLILLSIHHIILYFFISFSFDEVGFLMWRVFVNILTTMFLVLLSQYFVFKK